MGVNVHGLFLLTNLTKLFQKGMFVPNFKIISFYGTGSDPYQDSHLNSETLIFKFNNNYTNKRPKPTF